MHAGLLHGRFRLLKKLGEGGTGEVYEAEDTRLKRRVALKRARGKTEPERKARAVRLLREAEILARIDHPGVVTVHDFIDGEMSVSLVLELIEGQPFQRVIQKRALEQHAYLPYLGQMLVAVKAVHDSGIIHRDLNPRNIMVRPDGVIKLTDFGLAHPADQADARAGGTLGYMAPEALRKDTRPTFGVDLYALGFISYQALLGMPAFQRLYGTSSSLEWARWLLSRERFKTLTELEAPVSQGLSAIIERLLEKDPTKRYQRVGDLARDLERLGGRPLPGDLPQLPAAGGIR